ncbi:MAG TPA: alpha/beta hydrolase, partial [Verrucomicrobiae bacterium]|nr:alpha/beta hydrolase [Verrucomicrobiae bacterium]
MGRRFPGREQNRRYRAELRGGESGVMVIRMKRPQTWKRFCGALLAGGISIIIVLRWFEHNQVYHPSRNWYATGDELGRPFEKVFFESSDGVKLSGWFFAVSGNSPDSHPTALVCHGNAGNISHRLDLCRVLLDEGLNVFLFDYRGYGLSEGRPSEDGTYRDAKAAFQWLNRKGLHQIIAYGESLGGGVASQLCLEQKTAGLILQSTFTSIPDIGADLFP